MIDVCEKLDLTLDEMYKDKDGFITLIVGEILPDTIEYEKGFRFFDGMGVMYCPNGTCLHSTITGNELIAEATAEEISKFSGHNEIIDLEMAAVSPQRFIPTSDVNFRLGLFGRYVNRMGFIVTNRLDCFTPMGQRYASHKSMRDIVYRIRL